MNAVYKYTFPIDDYFRLEMPKDAKILSLQVQMKQPYLWALVDLENEYEDRKFRLVGTGHPFIEEPAQLAFVGTFQLADGALVFHLFEVLP